MTQQWDDDQLIFELGAALAPPDVPRHVVEAAQGAYTWRTVDAELAALVQDSTLVGPAAGVRGEAGPRTLSFQAGHVVLEIEVAPDGLVGQVVPPVPGTVEVHRPGAQVQRVEVDEVGSFVLRTVEPGVLRLSYLPHGGGRVVTTWVTV